jgi:hypothetical protein
MIHHLSISANNPPHVAKVLAEIFKGKTSVFPPNHHSYMVLAGDEYGTLVEIYPLRSEIIPGSEDQQVSFQQNPQPSIYTATHAAISVPSSLEEIEAIGQREGWRVLSCKRDELFTVIEFWVENRLMLELLTPDIVQEYLNLMHPSNLDQLIGQLNQKV